jgi:hypothetical protein
VKYADELVLLAKEETVLQGMIDKLNEIGRSYKYNNENLRGIQKTKKCSAACPLLKWNEKRLVTGLHSADKYASRQFHVISYSLVFHVCMLQNETAVLNQMTDVLSHLLAPKCSVSSFTYRDDSCATRVVGDNRH